MIIEIRWRDTAAPHDEHGEHFMPVSKLAHVPASTVCRLVYDEQCPSWGCVRHILEGQSARDAWARMRECHHADA